MEYCNLGKSEIKVNRLCLGTMSFGWECDESTSRVIMDRYVEAGGNFFDTANIYGNGESEAIIGRWMKDKKRDDIVVATKVRFSTGKGPNAEGLGKKHILASVDASLKRLRTDFIDLYQVHCWDARTPLEETLNTLDFLVKSGKVRFIGVSNFTGWQLQKALDISRFMDLENFICLQALYNILDRYLEWDLIPVLQNEGLALMCWSPLAGGWLTELIRKGMTTPPKNSRIEEAEKKGWSESWSNYDEARTWKILDVCFAVADETGKSLAQVALNWLLQRPGVSCAVLGVNQVEQLEDNLNTLNWKLTKNQMNRLNKISELELPRYPYRFINRFS